jgi:hypothetical protein
VVVSNRPIRINTIFTARYNSLKIKSLLKPRVPFQTLASLANIFFHVGFQALTAEVIHVSFSGT